MPPLYRIAEVALYSLLNFLPYIILALYPFRNQFRFSRGVTIALVGCVSVVQMTLGVLSAFSTVGVGILSAASTVIYASFYFVAIKAHFGKTLFFMLILSNTANFIVSCSKCIEGFIAPTNALEDYRWTFSAVMILVEILYLIPLFFYIKKIFPPLVENDSVKLIARYLWLIPAIFYFIWFYHFYIGEHESSLELALKPSNSIFLLIVNVGALLIYYVTNRLVYEMNKNAELSEKNHQLVMQKLHYNNLQERINEARQAKHDIRHHITVIDSYVQNSEYDKLHEYLVSYKKSLPDDSSIIFCQHYTVNALLLYFAQQAKNNNIDYDVSINLPENIGISDYVLSVVLGNLIENAVEAAAKVTNRIPRINLRGKTENNAVFFRIENTFSGELKCTREGLYLSTKHKGCGIGLVSVQNVVAQHNGMMETEQKDGVFCVSLLMKGPIE